MVTDTHGKQIGYHVFESLDHSVLPDFYKKHGYYRVSVRYALLLRENFLNALVHNNNYTLSDKYVKVPTKESMGLEWPLQSLLPSNPFFNPASIY